MNETIPQPELDEVCSSLTLHLNHDDIAQGQLGHLVDLLDPAHNEPALLRHLRGKVAFAFELNARRHLRRGTPSEPLRHFIRRLHAELPGLAWLLRPCAPWLALLAVSHSRQVNVFYDRSTRQCRWRIARADAESTADSLARGLVQFGRYLGVDYDAWADLESPTAPSSSGWRSDAWRGSAVWADEGSADAEGGDGRRIVCAAHGETRIHPEIASARRLLGSGCPRQPVGKVDRPL